MKKLLILFTLFLIGCSSASTPTPTIVPVTPTKISTPTSIPTPTRYPSLQTDGPYLLFQNDIQSLLMMDADGTGRKMIELPPNIYFRDFENAVSPNGEWIAYFTGTANEEPYDLALNILNLKNNSSFRITNLLLQDYPENLQALTELIYSEDDPECEIECKIRILESEIRTGIYYFDWSPNSKEIAFAAQIDGISSDIYIHNIEENSIRRLTNEPGNIGLMIEWSPNEKKILYSSTESNTTYSLYPLHIADATNTSLQNPPVIERGNLFWFGEGWIDENSYLIWDGGEGAPPHNFRYINTNNQQINYIWKYFAHSYTIDFKQKEIFLLTYPTGNINFQPEPSEGMYLINFDGKYIKLTSKDYFPRSKGPSNTYFILDIENNLDNIFPLLSIDTNGKIKDIDKEIEFSYPPNNSPDDNWTILTDENNTYLYSAKLEPIKSWDISYSVIIWRPDSKGFFIQDYDMLYYVSMNDEGLNLINVCPSQDCSFRDYVWIP